MDYFAMLAMTEDNMAKSDRAPLFFLLHSPGLQPGFCAMHGDRQEKDRPYGA